MFDNTQSFSKWNPGGVLYTGVQFWYIYIYIYIYIYFDVGKLLWDCRVETLMFVNLARQLILSRVKFHVIIFCFSCLICFVSLLISRHIGCASWGDGFSFQEIREGLSSRCCVACLPYNDRWLLAWNYA